MSFIKKSINLLSSLVCFLSLGLTLTMSSIAQASENTSKNLNSIATQPTLLLHKKLECLMVDEETQKPLNKGKVLMDIFFNNNKPIKTNLTLLKSKLKINNLIYNQDYSKKMLGTQFKNDKGYYFTALEFAGSYDDFKNDKNFPVFYLTKTNYENKEPIYIIKDCKPVK